MIGVESTYVIAEHKNAEKQSNGKNQFLILSY